MKLTPGNVLNQYLESILIFNYFEVVYIILQNIISNILLLSADLNHFPLMQKW